MELQRCILYGSTLHRWYQICWLVCAL